ncbi:MAG TPA: DUF2142 domain-containing protein [Candidatus Acidoferrum sp.]|nr:DUF2142 domain-containing protein [Candidatus Acidoferrum sp.]
MQNGANATDPPLPSPALETRERRVIWLFCLLAAVHVVVFSAAFPFFNNVDEQIHFDLVVKYSQGHLPRSLDSISAEAVPYAVLFGSPEFVGIPTNQPGRQFPPPPWHQPVDEVRQTLAAKTEAWHNVVNHEASQPPLYYAVAGAWWWLGKWLGFHDGPLLYWLRFLNIFFAVALVWLGYAAARLVFPDREWLRLAVPALLTFLPQTALYSIQNDVLSPLCFGAAFIGLVKWLRAEVPGVQLGALTGLALAATFLTKISNLPLLLVSAGALLLKIWNLAKTGKLRAAGPATAVLLLCAGLPMLAWLAWCMHSFGDFTGTAAKIQFLGWTRKPLGEWWSHPIFSPHGLWTFVSGLLATFWQGEILWHRQPLTLPVVNLIYTIASAGLVGAAVIALHLRSGTTAPQRQALRLALGCVAAAVVFLGFLSIIYDFHDCFYPSREHPYFTSGRLMLGALIPFLLLSLFGLDRILGRVKKPWLRPVVLAAMVLFMLVSEIATDWRLFPNAYNWFHM